MIIAMDGDCRKLLTPDRLHSLSAVVKRRRKRMRGDPGNYAPARRDKLDYFY